MEPSKRAQFSTHSRRHFDGRPKRFAHETPHRSISDNGTHVMTSTVRLQYAFPPVAQCTWTVYLLLCPLANNMGRLSSAAARRYDQPAMLTEMADLLRIYEARSYVKIGPWAKVDRGGDLSISYDPNTELNWTNQESALCDCLLSYKKAASFIIFADLDGVLVPRLATI
ncbi:unnamed protein product [Toxocara canis]|uniref:Glycosyltransferase family 92 protein n=1 Tax=Toxocara canis TaxID=6265 RepID=A0A183UG58_TOXCA|nr:unnamed protein product [Toxocara canis]